MTNMALVSPRTVKMPVNTKKTRNTELRREVDELREQIRVQGDALGEIRQLLVTMAERQSRNPPAAEAASLGVNGENGGQFNNGNQFNFGNPNFQIERLLRIEFPKFYGDDIKGWMYKAEQFFDYMSTPEEKKVQTAMIYMEGKALQWHQAYMKGRLGAVPSWSDYGRAIYLQHADPLGKLVALKQTGGVQEFLDKFDELLNQVDITEEQSIRIFLANLKPEVEVQVRMLGPRTLMKAYNQEKLAEQSLKLQMGHTQSLVRNSRPLLANPQGFWGSQSKGGSSRPVDNTKGFNTVNKPPYQGTRRLSTTEMDEKRAKGLCYWCDEKYTLKSQM
ncbi:uncharacterized protein LOC124886031 [Capsicum annuum]|uniref:uncharacterized protein LOC124886031 n=1 Tax=Capsicum annuum TaxID=4072 RepID=UPI001FB1333C|nr:uncharacterized protein LOC124886031 [Capsicum annuum]